MGGDVMVEQFTKVLAESLVGKSVEAISLALDEAWAAGYDQARREFGRMDFPGVDASVEMPVQLSIDEMIEARNRLIDAANTKQPVVRLTMPTAKGVPACGEPLKPPSMHESLCGMASPELVQLYKSVEERR